MPRTADPALEVLWRRRLLQQSRCGLSILQFCQREGVSPASFHAWKRRLASHSTRPGATPPAASASAFVPVLVASGPDLPSRDSADHVTFLLTNGGRILLPITADADLVCLLATIVAQAPGGGERPSC
jgi:hypothetical protein